MTKGGNEKRGGERADAGGGGQEERGEGGRDGAERGEGEYAREYRGI